MRRRDIEGQLRLAGEQVQVDAFRDRLSQRTHIAHAGQEGRDIAAGKLGDVQRFAQQRLEERTAQRADIEGSERRGIGDMTP